jgi:hypothetical protein
MLGGQSLLHPSGEPRAYQQNLPASPQLPAAHSENRGFSRRICVQCQFDRPVSD